MAIGILIDPLGTYMVLSTLGIAIATLYSEGATQSNSVLKRIICFPPTPALALAMALNGVIYPDLVQNVLHSLAATLAPKALILVGLQLRLAALRGNVVGQCRQAPAGVHISGADSLVRSPCGRRFDDPWSPSSLHNRARLLSPAGQTDPPVSALAAGWPRAAHRVEACRSDRT